jgi:hypothetical protein
MSEPKIRRQAAKLHLNAKQIADLMAQMRGDSKFQLLFDNIYEYRETAIYDLCNDSVVGDPNKVFAAIGEIRAYSALLSLAGEARTKAPSAPDSEAGA